MALQPDRKRPPAHQPRRCIGRYSKREDRRSPSLGWISAVTIANCLLGVRRRPLPSVVRFSASRSHPADGFPDGPNPHWGELGLLTPFGGSSNPFSQSKTGCCFYGT